MFEGVPNYPDTSRFWRVVDKHQVNIFYTAPTALRALMREGSAPYRTPPDKACACSAAWASPSIRKPGNGTSGGGPEALPHRRYLVADRDRRHHAQPAARQHPPQAGLRYATFVWRATGAAGRKGKVIEGPGAGLLVIKASWPGQIRSVYGDHQRMVDTYFKPMPGYYFTGDGARRDADGDYWITGRVDDVINVSGHRIGTAEVESALVLHDSIAEAAVVGYPHDLKGQGIYAFITPMNGVTPDDTLKNELLALVSKEIGSFAKPELIQWAPALPKTRSGKIMRRILRKIACNELDNLGDTSTLADPTVVGA